MSINYLSAENITKTIGDRTLFADITFGMSKGEKVALIAKNGTGKTTFLKILAGLETPDSGEVQFRNGIQVTYLPQEPYMDPGANILETVMEADLPEIRMLKEYRRALRDQDHDRINSLLPEMERLKVWDIESRINETLDRLGVNMPDQLTGNLSGGQRKRVALAKALLSNPDLLIMDEPTNHLDLDMIEWLENQLTDPNLTLLMVTHDRYFLENVCNVIVEMANQQLFKYQGNYSYYLDKKAEREAQEMVNLEKSKNLYRKELDWISRQPKARGTKAKARVDQFEQLKQDASKSIKKDELELEINMQRLGTKTVELHNIRKSYGDKILIDGFKYTFKRGEKVGIVGPNGTGKSTLLNILTGKVEPDGGKVVIGDTVVFGYYTQEGMKLKDEKRVIEVVKDIAEVFPLTKGRTISASQMLERFLFPRDQHYQYVSKLSGGEKRRLYLLTVLMKNPNFLILDEPTNDLDILTLQVLEDFLEHFPGCLIVVTHDRFFMNRIVDHLFVFEGQGKIRDFNGTYAEWRARRELEAEQKVQEVKEVKQEQAAPARQKEGKRKPSFNEKREFEQLEQEIEELEERKAFLTEAMNASGIDYTEIEEKARELEQLNKILEEKSDRWLELAEIIQ